MAKLSVELERYFFQEDRDSQVTLVELLKLAGERVFGFLLVILSLPSALPVPAPGYSIPFGILMFLLAIQLIMGRKIPWLPQRMKKASVKLKTAQSFLKAGLPWLRRIEGITRPRFPYICNSFPGRLVIGGAIALMSIFMMIPIPGTNTLPAIGIFITAFGLQEDDGLISLSGLVICVIAAVLVTAIIFTGVNILDNLKDWLVSR